ncbi:UNVERIFIED_CONTAM: type II toxin-antitoxin system Phd/YefM family antitoxin [Kocuria sp. CPCC 205274]
MPHIKASNLRTHFKETLEAAEREPVIITRRSGQNLALITEEALLKYKKIALEVELADLFNDFDTAFKGLANK